MKTAFQVLFCSLLVFVVALGRQDGWARISDSSSSASYTSTVEAVPTEPRIPLKMWEGWWEPPANERVKGKPNNRLLIVPTKEPGSLRVSGRAYWYGPADVVHSGQVSGEAAPVGKYLHLSAGSCVIELELASDNPPVMRARQNEVEAGACGGMNVSFGGTWVKFTPHSKKKSRS